MAFQFSDLKSKRGSSLNKLIEEAKKVSSKGEKDDRYWTLTTDKAGNGSAIIRFLPSQVEENSRFVRYFDHGFQGPGGWYLEKSLTTLDQADPVSELNGQLWNSGIDADKEVARKQKRRQHFVSNILVVRDPSNPDNDGKVFLFRYGKKLFDKIMSISEPDELDGRPGIDPFDLWEGANFRLRAQTVDDYRNYDKSTFDNPTAISEDDEDMERIWKLTHDLNELIAPSQFKTYDELKARLERVLGTVVRNTTIEDDMETLDAAEEIAPRKPKQMEPKEQKATSSDEEDDEEFFRSLASVD